MSGLILVYFIVRPKVIYIIIELYIYFCIILIFKLKKWMVQIFIIYFNTEYFTNLNSTQQKQCGSSGKAADGKCEVNPVGRIVWFPGDETKQDIGQEGDQSKETKRKERDNPCKGRHINGRL